MQYLLDTHVILWWFTDPKKIKPKARNVIQDKSNVIFLSSASFWEMAIKKSIGRLTPRENYCRLNLTTAKVSTILDTNESLI